MSAAAFARELRVPVMLQGEKSECALASLAVFTALST
jgi:hypothetical protein